MAAPFIVHVNSAMLPTVVGQTVDSDSIILRRKTAYDQLQGTEAASAPPFALTHPAQVEGVDFPFYTRTEDEFPYTAHWKRKWNFYAQLPAMEGSPVPILAADPDTTPLFMGRMLEFPFEKLTKRKKLDRWAATIEPFSTFPGLLAGGEYSDNLCRVLSEIQRHMLEHTIDSGVTWAIWTEEEVREAFLNRLTKFIGDTGIIRRRDLFSIPAGTITFSINNDSLEIRRVVVDVAGVRSVLTRTDEFVLTGGYPGWQAETGTPFAYVEQPRESLEIRLYPIPSIAMDVEVTVVPAPPQLSGCDVIPIPAPFVPYVKYGTMADLLAKEGEANDPERATYCENRWMEGVELARALLGVGV